MTSKTHKNSNSSTVWGIDLTRNFQVLRRRFSPESFGPMIVLKTKCFALCMLTDLGIPSSTFAQNAKTNHSSQSMDSLSYALGVLFANNLSNEGLSSVDGASLKSGFEATRRGGHLDRS